MTEITDLSTTDSSNTTVTGESIDGAIANMGRMDNTLQAILGLLARSIRTNVLRFLDNADPTKKVALDLSGLPTATTRTLGVPYYSGTLGLVSDIRGQIYGLTLSNNVTDATNDIDIAAGSAVDNTGAVSMLLASGLTKQLDAVWAVGNNAGMRASGAAIANGTYHIFLIRRPDTGVVDIAADTSATGANIAANTNAAYTQIRRIGSILRESGAIVGFVQDGDVFTRKTPVGSGTINNPGTSAILIALGVPTGIRVKARFGFLAGGTNANLDSPLAVLVSDPSATDVVPSLTAFNFYVFSAATLQTVGAVELNVETNTSGQVRYRLERSAGGTNLNFSTLGWTDTRGA